MLWQLEGDGTIRALHLKMPDRVTDAELDGLRLEVRYGAEAESAIDVPVSHFFGAGHKRVPYRSLPLGTDGPEGYYCYWPMPYRSGVTVALRNTTRGKIAIASGRLEYDPASPATDAGYLHAVYRQEHTNPQLRYHVLLDAAGSGHYVGNLLYFSTVAGGAPLLEGDDVIVVNPGKSSQRVLNGTGMEDAYNGGYYYNNSSLVPEVSVPADPPFPASGIGPFHGLLRIHLSTDILSDPTRVDQYRWMIGDFVPFADGIAVKIEIFAPRVKALFGSTAFYYATPNASGQGDGASVSGERIAH